MSAELDKQCAAALGWTCEEEETWSPLTESIWRNASGHKVDFPPTSQMLEDEIVRRGLTYKYVLEISGVLDLVAFDEWLWIWKSLRATPEQRARAFLEAVK
jgi:hypothetical protein